MRTLKTSQKGKGWLGNRWKEFRRYVTGRKRTMKKVNNRGTMKVASKETEKRESAKSLKQRPGYQKMLNKVLYKKGELKSVPEPSSIEPVEFETTERGTLKEGELDKYLNTQELNQLGIANFPREKDKREPFNKRQAKIPDSQVPDPGPIPYGPTRDPVTNTNGTIIDKKESQIETQVRNLPIFYAIWKQWLTIDDLTTNIMLQDPHYYETVKEALEENNRPVYFQDINERELRNFLDEVKYIYHEERVRIGGNDDMIAHEQAANITAERLFHSRVDLIQTVLTRLEYAGPTNQERYIIPTVQRTVDGNYEDTRKIAVVGANTLHRYISFLESGLDYIKITYEQNSHRCGVFIGRASRPGGYIDIFSPLTTLKSNQCVKIVNGFESFLGLAQMTGDSVFFTGNWIALQKKYFPLRGENTQDIVAKAIPHASYIQKAFNDWAIEGLDTYLYQLFDIKYPFYSMKISTFLTTPERFLRLKTTVEREREDYPVGRGKFEFVNFMIVDKAILQDTPTFLAHVNPFEGSTKVNDLVSKAIQSQAIYGVSPYIGYFMKRKVMSAYFNAFKTPDVSKVRDPLTQILRVYVNLPTEQEKITFDFLQYLLVLDRFQGEVTQPLNQGRAAANQFKERFSRVQSIYREPLTQENSNRILRLFTAGHVEALANLQSMVDTRPPNTTTPFIRSVLRKFTSTVMQGTFNNAYQEGRLTATQRVINTRKAERNAVQARINALEQQKTQLAKAWNPFQKKTRKQRQNQIDRNLAALQKNFEIKQRFLSMAEQQRETAENNILRSRPFVVNTPVSGVRTTRRSFGLPPTSNPFFNND